MNEKDNSKRIMIIFLASIFIGGPLSAWIIVTVTAPKRLQSSATNFVSTPSYSDNIQLGLDSQETSIKPTEKSNNHTYSFEGMIGKPWTVYKVEGGQLRELGLDDKEFDEENKKWNQFTLSIRDINIICKSDSANVTIKDSTGDKHYNLVKTGKNTYLMEHYPSRIILKTPSSLVCELYFIIGEDATSVSNMDYDAQK